MAPAKTRSRDKSSLPKYRVELPILLDDMNLSVYAFRLYVHLKRVAERSDEGSCWESARTLATACSMSSGQVSKAKDELEQKQLITRHIKMMRGGIGDDITIVDIWPQNFVRYAPESDPRKESDHHTITSTPEVIATRSLSASDHHTITFEPSDQEVITLTSKRSPGDPIDHDQYHIESQHGDVGGDDRARVENAINPAFIRELCARRAQGMPMNPKSAERIAARVAYGQSDEQTILASLDMLIATNTGMGAIVDLLNNDTTIPPKGHPYERPIHPQSPPNRPKRSAGSHNGTGASDLKDPGWRERLIELAERGELP